MQFLNECLKLTKLVLKSQHPMGDKSLNFKLKKTLSSSKHKYFKENEKFEKQRKVI